MARSLQSPRPGKLTATQADREDAPRMKIIEIPPEITPSAPAVLLRTFATEYELSVNGSIMKTDARSPAAKQAMFEAIVKAVAIRNEKGHKVESANLAPDKLHARGELAPGRRVHVVGGKYKSLFGEVLNTTAEKVRVKLDGGSVLTGSDEPVLIAKSNAAVIESPKPGFHEDASATPAPSSFLCTVNVQVLYLAHAAPCMHFISCRTVACRVRCG
jgi:hypothetical protein